MKKLTNALLLFSMFSFAFSVIGCDGGTGKSTEQSNSQEHSSEQSSQEQSSEELSSESSEEQSSEQLSSELSSSEQSEESTSDHDSQEMVVPSSISFEHDVFTLVAGETLNLQAKVGPENAHKNYVISYSSSNVEVAVIDEHDVLTAVKEGESTITARIEEYDLEASMLLRVYPGEYTFIKEDDGHQYDQTAPKKFPTFTDDPSQVDEAKGIYRYSPEIVYELREDGESYRVLGLDSTNYDNNNAYISPTYNGKPVVEIAEGAFAYKWYVFNIYIPSSIKIIKNAAFSNTGVKNLYYDAEEITDFPGSNWIFYPQEPTEFPASALVQNIHLLVGPHAKCIPSRFFHPVGIYPQIKPKVASIEFAEGCQLKSIGEYAFYDLQNITSIKLPETLETIGDYAFYNTGIKELYLPDSVKEIGQYAFMFADSLQNIRLSPNLETIGESAFSSCTALEYLSFKSTKLEEVGNYAFKNCSSLAYLDLGNLQYINESAFENCAKLKQIYVPDSVLEIHYNAFRGCTDAEILSLGRNITFIGKQAFSDLVNLKKLFINCSQLEGLPSGNKTFYKLGKDNSNGIDVIYCEGIRETAERMFFANSDVETFIHINKLYLPRSLTSIANYTFYGANIDEVIYEGDAEAYNKITIGDHNDLKTPTYLGGL